MKPSRARRVLFGLAVLHVAMFVVLASIRLRYPFELEWMEGGIVDEVRWVMSGKKIYVEPSVDYVPFIYGPFYFWVTAAVSKLVGIGFFSARLVSFLSTVGTFGLLYFLVSRETESRGAGLLAAGVYAGTFRRVSQMMDMARVDALAVLLALAAVCVLRRRVDLRGQVAAAALASLAYLTKQSMLAIVLALALHVIVDQRRRAVPFVATLLVGTVGVTWVLDHVYEGWFSYYAFELPKHHAWNHDLWLLFWTDDVFGAFGVAVGFAVYWFVTESDRSVRRLYLFALLGAVASSWSSRLHSGGWTNVLMPLYALLAIPFACGVLRALEGTLSRGERRLELAVLVAGCVQVAQLAYDPRHLVPKRADEAAGRQLLEKIAATPGEVFIPTHSYYPALVGKRTFAHQMAVDDVLRGPDGAEKAAVVVSINRALRDKRFSLVITDNDFFDRAVLESYRRAGDAFERPDVFFPVAGVHYRPGGLFVPK